MSESKKEKIGHGPVCHGCGGRAQKTGVTDQRKRTWRCVECGRVWSDPPTPGAIHPICRKIALAMLAEGFPPWLVADLCMVSRAWAYEQAERQQRTRKWVKSRS